MERIISVWSDRNIWEHFWRWCNLIGPTGFLCRVCQIVLASSALLYPAYKYNNQTRGTVPWIEHVKFPKFQETGIFVAYKAPLVNYIYRGGRRIQFLKAVENWGVQFSLGEYNFYFCVFTLLKHYHSLTHSLMPVNAVKHVGQQQRITTPVCSWPASEWFPRCAVSGVMQSMSRHVILPCAFGKEGTNSSMLCAKTFMK